MYHDKDASKTAKVLQPFGLGEQVSAPSIALPHFFARVNPIMKLSGGEISGHFATFSRDFDELPPQAMVSGDVDLPSVCDWVATSLKKTFIARTKLEASETNNAHMPLLIPAPSALFHLADSSSQCEEILSKLVSVLGDMNAPRATCFVFKDSCLAGDATDRAGRLQAFRNHGLRLAVDWRSSWTTQFDPNLARLFDTALVPHAAMLDDPDLLVRIYEAKLSEIPIVIDGAKWRDYDELSESGIHYVINPICDG